ncbi:MULTISPECIES: hypothetical protein [unclassified Streptomyces]|uniref:hypothetical protein n=1 Tax=unclassified Streptomyces TaxID=2593676 RepID=UPI003807C11B
MADSGQRRWGPARLLTLCAVLFGLFLMHGAPAGAASGCHGPGSATAVTPHGHGSAAMTPMVHVARTHPGSVQARTVDGAALHDGAVCVSTPARDRLPLPAPALAALAALAGLTTLVWAARLRSPAGTGRRGPPTGGRGLLLQVCIART